MKKMKKILSMFCITLVMIVLGMPTLTQAKVLGVIRQQQQKSKWCWAASSVMVGSYNVSTTIGQEDVVARAWGNTLPNVAGNVSLVASSIEYVSNYTKSSSVKSFFSLSEAQAQIDKSHPFAIRMLWDSGTGHIIVCAGYNAAALYIIDPWENTPTRYYSYSTLSNGGTIETGTGHATNVVVY